MPSTFTGRSNACPLDMAFIERERILSVKIADFLNVFSRPPRRIFTVGHPPRLFAYSRCQVRVDPISFQTSLEQFNAELPGTLYKRSRNTRLKYNQSPKAPHTRRSPNEADKRQRLYVSHRFVGLFGAAPNFVLQYPH